MDEKAPSPYGCFYPVSGVLWRQISRVYFARRRAERKQSRRVREQGNDAAKAAALAADITAAK